MNAANKTTHAAGRRPVNHGGHAASARFSLHTWRAAAAGGRRPRPPPLVPLRLYQTATRLLAAFARSKRTLPPLFLTTAATVPGQIRSRWRMAPTCVPAPCATLTRGRTGWRASEFGSPAGTLKEAATQDTRMRKAARQTQTFGGGGVLRLLAGFWDTAQDRPGPATHHDSQVQPRKPKR